jgi:hypothetical protein
MKRLRDESTGDPLSERGIELLRDTPPAPPLPEMRRRIWNALQSQPQTRTSTAWSGAVRVRGLRAFAMAVTILALAGSAGGMIADRLIVPALERAAASSDQTRPRAPSAVRSRSARSISGARIPATTPPVAPPAADAKLALAPPAAGPSPDVTRPRRSRPVTTSAQARTQVLDALVALRRDRDPVRAGELLNRYLALPGRGALREEALVLAIEAADARADQVQARRFAQAYLAEYPQGRFGQFARNYTAPSASRSSTPTLRLDDVPAGAARSPRAE